MKRLTYLVTIAALISGVSIGAPTADSQSIRAQAAELEAALQSKFQGYVLLASACGAAGDGQSGDTVALQRCIDSLPSWATLDGESKTYLVSSVSLKSRMRMRNFRLVKLAGTANMTSPVTLDGRMEAKEDVVIENVIVDGRRQLEQSILTPSAEDGGRHCFRIAGRITNVVLIGVSGNYCGADGLQLGGQHATVSDAPEALPLQNIVIRNAEFEWNRRVGIAFEGGHNVFFLDVKTRFNGRSLEGAADPSSGSYCAHVNEQCFGTGVWTENDHDAAGGSFDSVYFVNLHSTQNFTRAFYGFSNSGPRVAGFRAKSNLVITESVLDAGVQPIAGNPIAVQFSSSSPDGAGAVYRGMTIAQSRIEGTICGRSIESIAIRNSIVTAPLLGFLEYFNDVEVSQVERNGDFLSSLWLQPDGSPGAVVRY